MVCFTAQYTILNALNIYSYDAGSNLELLAVPPVDLIGESSTGTSAATVSSNYELLVTVEMSRWDEQGPQQLSDISFNRLFLNQDSDVMCLKHRQLQSASKMDELKTFIPDHDGCNDKGGSAKEITKNTDQNFEQDKNSSDLNKEMDALRKKLAMYERLNKFMELDSLASKYGSKMRQNILLISDSTSGSSLLGELLNQHPDVF
ncbi:hypothetical protein AWC38_SpisGene7658 [Stylophora pistillata]|uniref:Uncharacterized protein n=1 Tax=Stylophora pistillata TaxID=50429 RepID=A0A2B4SAG7_STYPI|nr:hypothetical protein AWC38_SpisGene7658 [Stylophora pistillata]